MTRRSMATMPKQKLSPEGEVIAAYGATMVAAFQVLVGCLGENEAMHPGQFTAALAVYMTVAVLREAHGSLRGSSFSLELC
jgi:hypothetical protein